MARFLTPERVIWYSGAAALVATLYAGFSVYNPKDALKTPSLIERAEVRVAEVPHLQIPMSLEPPLPSLQEYRPDRIHISPNYRQGRSRPIDTIVLHTTESSADSAEAWLTNPLSRVSAHYLVAENGETVQLVDPHNTAWHVRGHNSHSIGVEFAGYHDQRLADHQIQEGTRLIHYLMEEYDIPRENIRAHSSLDPQRREDPGEENFNLILVGLGR